MDKNQVITVQHKMIQWYLKFSFWIVIAITWDNSENKKQIQ